MTTPEQFDLFCEECNKWVDEYGLTDWEVLYKHDRLDGNAQAMTDWNHTAHLVVFVLDSDGHDGTVTDDAIRKSAHHEVLELLLTDMDVICSLESTNEQEKNQLIAASRHSIIHRLMHCESSRRKRMNKLLEEQQMLINELKLQLELNEM